jgi:hypothetical protein
MAAGKERRGSLMATVAAAKAQATAEPETQPGPSGGRLTPPLEGMTTTAIHVPRDTLALLRRVAVERANRDGGRPSVSGVLVDLVEANRVALEQEART